MTLTTPRNSLRNHVVTIVAIVQQNLEYPRCADPRNLSPYGQHFPIAQHGQRSQPGAVDDQIYVPVLQNTVDVVHLRLHEASAHVDEPIEQVRQQSHRLAREGREVVSPRVGPSVFIA